MSLIHSFVVNINQFTLKTMKKTSLIIRQANSWEWTYLWSFEVRKARIFPTALQNGSAMRSAPSEEAVAGYSPPPPYHHPPPRAARCSYAKKFFLLILFYLHIAESVELYSDVELCLYNSFVKKFLSRYAAEKWFSAISLLHYTAFLNRSAVTLIGCPLLRPWRSLHDTEIRDVQWQIFRGLVSSGW